MVSYRLYFFRPRSHGLVRFADFEAPSDDAAMAFANEERGELALELWRDHKKLAEIDGINFTSRVWSRPRLALETA
jgi:hypothetical protein